jgi:spore coat protein CotH
MRPNQHLGRNRRTHLGVFAAALMFTACGSSGAKSSTDGSAATGDGPVEVFDTSVVHEVSMSYDQGDYDSMIETFRETGEKEWIEVTVTIDGETYEHAGTRLKGNSSLAGLGGGFRPGGGFGGAPDGDAAETSEEQAGETPATEDGGEGDPQSGGPGGPSGSADAESPEDLPWLIRLDEFVDGQDHQGYEDLVVRSNGSETSLNEAVALDLLDEAGLASQRAASTSFTVNDGEPALRLIIEHPDDDAWYEEAFDSTGALYKAESSGDWSYRGDDPAAYEEVFDQEGGSDITDLTPLIDFLQFVNQSDDETFAAELPERLDVEAFATYLAMMGLIGNFDDIDGPGNNAYIWYDAEAGQFTVVPWDMNLAFGGTGFRLGGQNGAEFPGEGEPPTDLPLPEGFDREDLPEGFQPPEGFDPGELPEGFEPPGGFNPGQIPGGERGPGAGFGRSNVLVERFHDTSELEELYQRALTDLRASLYDSGVADEILAARVETLNRHATDLVDADTIASEAESISAVFTGND